MKYFKAGLIGTAFCWIGPFMMTTQMFLVGTIVALIGIGLASFFTISNVKKSKTEKSCN